jgi:hypothetical protein
MKTETETKTDRQALEGKAAEHVARPSKPSKRKGEPEIVAPPDPDAPPSKLRRLGGSKNEDFNQVLMNQIVNALWLAYSDAESRHKQIQAVLGGALGLEPKDEAEGMLIGQMIACHAAAMECFRRAMLKEQSFEGRQQTLNYGNKLSRTYALHLEALDKHRGKGQQKVTVEHVHVHRGGQAIVGDVLTGAGLPSKSEIQPHAITHAPEPEMRSALAQNRQAVPITGDEER